MIRDYPSINLTVVYVFLFVYGIYKNLIFKFRFDVAELKVSNSQRNLRKSDFPYIPKSPKFGQGKNILSIRLLSGY